MCRGITAADRAAAPRFLLMLLLTAAVTGFDAGGVGRDMLAGDPPQYGPPVLRETVNAPAIRARLWVPGLDAGFDPQGLALVRDRLFVSGYRSERLRQARGPCRVYEIDGGSGRVSGEQDLPPPCGHAGGLAYAGGRSLYVADTHTLFVLPLAAVAGAASEPIRRHPLGPGLVGGLAASDVGGIWIGTYREDGPGWLFRFDAAMLGALDDGATLLTGMAMRRVAIPSYAQGAAIDAAGRLWIARSDVDWGGLEVLAPATGQRLARYPAPAGLEGIAFAADGRLWGVSEAGARHIYDVPFAAVILPFNPVIFDIRVEDLRPPLAVLPTLFGWARPRQAAPPI